MEKPWFVVGGAGFVGQNLAKRRPCTVFDLVNGDDALDYELLVDAMRGHDTVVHLAANADIAAGADDPALDFAGIDITGHIAEAARECGVTRIIYLSGSGVYGHRSWGATEETPTVPVSSYGAAKLASEAILNAYAAMYDIKLTILRPANIVGPHQTHGVGFDFMRKLREDPTRIEILGDGMQSKQYVHVEDLLDAFGAPYGTHNVAAPGQLKVIQIAAMAVHYLGVNTKYEIKGGLAWPGDITRVKLDCSKLKRVGWRARSSTQAMHAALRVL